MAVQRKYLEMFLEEGAEIISELNRKVLRLEEDASDSDALQSALRLAHTLKGGARMVGLDNVSLAAHQMESTLEAATRRPSGPISGQGTRLLKTLDRMREVLDLVARGRDRDATAVDLLSIDGPPPAAETPPAPDRPETPPAPSPGNGRGRTAERPEERAGADRLRVRVEKLDGLQDLLDDIVLQKTRLLERAEGFRKALNRPIAELGEAGHASAAPALPRIGRLERREIAAFYEDLHQLDQMITDLQGMVFDLRMVPLAEVLDEYHRVVRDLARQLSKEVALTIDGKLTEIDKRLLDAIQGPLMHLVRNAVDHGVETAAERVRAGKPPRAQVAIRAYHKASTVVVEVEDDGRGLDADQIRRAAVTRGLMSEEEARNISDGDAYYLLCEPGFTTRETVTEVSGRGVGLDVVRVEVERLKGALSVQSERGRFTRFRMHLPLSISSISALIVRAGDLLCALPSLFVERCLRVDSATLSARDGTWPHGDRALPAVSLARALGLETRSEPGPVTLVVARFRSRTMAIQVDGLIAEREVILKPLGKHLQGVPSVLGVSFLADGSVLPVLNVVELHSRWGPLEATCRFQWNQTSRTPKILVVDDSMTTRHLEKSILEGLGYSVLQASDGLEAWKLLEREDFDLVLTDIEMPGMDGLDLTRAIRGSHEHRRIPVVAVSGRTRPEEAEEARAAGVDAFIRKDRFSQAELSRTLSSLMARFEGRSSPAPFQTGPRVILPQQPRGGPSEARQ